MKIISASKFYETWLKTVRNREKELLENWRYASKYTSIILKSENSIIEEVAKALEMNFYCEYYSIDAVLYNLEDKVQGVHEHHTLLHDIHIAIEHENYFNIKLQEEVAHLLLTNCRLKVLVTYPNDEIDFILNHLHDIIKNNRNSTEISEKENFLLILGYEKDFCWEGYIYKTEAWEKYNLKQKTQ